MTLDEFDARTRACQSLRRTIEVCQSEIAKIEDDTYKRANLEYVAREPGLPCWQFTGIDSLWFDTPRQALEWMEKSK